MVNKSLINLAAFLFLACILSGCTTIDYSKLEYGMSKEDVMEQLHIDKDNLNGEVFQFAGPEGVAYECYLYSNRKCYMNYYFLYSNSHLTSIVQDNDLQLFFSHKGFDEPKGLLPHENGCDTLLQPFIPPRPLKEIDFSKVDMERKESDSGPAQELGMLIGLAPFWVPALPIILPAAIYEGVSWKKVMAKENSIRLGDSYEDVLSILGEENTRTIGNPQTYGIVISGPSFGFRNNKVTWIRKYGFNAYYALPDGHKYKQ
jgi:hypothetical protein